MKKRRRPGTRDSKRNMALGISIVIFVMTLFGLRSYFDKSAPEQIAMGGETRIPLADDDGRTTEQIRHQIDTRFGS